ncbi:Transmembrane protein 35 [Sarcoptes scabiei]|nr:Transmembrane protein 35 [Sarcoptes scabiei]
MFDFDLNQERDFREEEERSRICAIENQTFLRRTLHLESFSMLSDRYYFEVNPNQTEIFEIQAKFLNQNYQENNPEKNYKFLQLRAKIIHKRGKILKLIYSQSSIDYLAILFESYQKNENIRIRIVSRPFNEDIDAIDLFSSDNYRLDGALFSSRSEIINRNTSKQSEMIEFRNLPKTIIEISYCRKSKNFLLIDGDQNRLIIYKYVEIEIDKKEDWIEIDFVRHLQIYLCWLPTKVSLLERFVCLLSHNYFVLFELNVEHYSTEITRITLGEERRMESLREKIESKCSINEECCIVYSCINLSKSIQLHSHGFHDIDDAGESIRLISNKQYPKSRYNLIVCGQLDSGLFEDDLDDFELIDDLSINSKQKAFLTFEMESIRFHRKNTTNDRTIDGLVIYLAISNSLIVFALKTSDGSAKRLKTSFWKKFSRPNLLCGFTYDIEKDLVNLITNQKIEIYATNLFRFFLNLDDSKRISRSHLSSFSSSQQLSSFNLMTTPRSFYEQRSRLLFLLIPDSDQDTYGTDGFIEMKASKNFRKEFTLRVLQFREPSRVIESSIEWFRFLRERNFFQQSATATASRFSNDSADWNYLKRLIKILKHSKSGPYDEIGMDFNEDGDRICDQSIETEENHRSKVNGEQYFNFCKEFIQIDTNLISLMPKMMDRKEIDTNQFSTNNCCNLKLLQYILENFIFLENFHFDYDQSSRNDLYLSQLKSSFHFEIDQIFSLLKLK